MPYIGVKTLPRCSCRGKPKIERCWGWWHIECSICGKYPVEYMPGSKCVRVYGWNSRNEAIAAWNNMHGIAPEEEENLA